MHRTHRTHRTTVFAGTGLALFAVAFISLLTPFAKTVTSVVPGPWAASDPTRMLGAPKGLGANMGSTDTYTLGVGGQVVLELDARAVDGPGTDLVVYENPFVVLGSFFDTWVELCTVEVSTTGFDWIAFPTQYLGPQGPFNPLIGLPNWWFRGFAGVSTFAASSEPGGTSPLDIVHGGGDAFDLADLAGDPLVAAGLVDLQNIRYVRLTDVQAGQETDGSGHIVWDCGDVDFAATDIDAICATNNTASVSLGRPWVELSIEPVGANDWLFLEIGDPNGLWQVVPNISASNNGLIVSFYNLLHYFVILELDDVHVRLAAGPVVPQIPPTLMKVAVEDGTGLRAGDAVYFP